MKTKGKIQNRKNKIRIKENTLNKEIRKQK